MEAGDVRTTSLTEGGIIPINVRERKNLGSLIPDEDDPTFRNFFRNLSVSLGRQVVDGDGDR